MLVELNDKELFKLAKMVERSIGKSERRRARPQEAAKREELAGEGKGDVTQWHIDQAQELHDRLYAAAVQARHGDRERGVVPGIGGNQHGELG